MALVWQVFTAVVSVVAVVLVVVKIYVKCVMGWCHSKIDLTGKTALVTGANTGIGFWTALDLARRNARVILACRNVQKGEAACLDIIMKTGNMNVVVKQLDLSLMKSVRQFAKNIVEEEPRLDILVNNAGVAALPLTMTEEGFEMTLATNHFGPFLLTNLLLDLLKNSQPSRIVNVSSVTHGWTNEGIMFDNLRAEKDYNSNKFYQCSKLANVLFTRELARRIEGTGLTVYSLHPGYIASDIWRNLSILASILIAFPKFCCFKTPEEGAQTSIYCAVSEEVEGESGKYYVDCKEADDQSSEMSKDMGVAKKLWEISERYTGRVKSE